MMRFTKCVLSLIMVISHLGRQTKASGDVQTYKANIELANGDIVTVKQNEHLISANYTVQSLVGDLNIFTFNYTDQEEAPKFLHVISACSMKDTLKAWECSQKNDFVSNLEKIDIQRISYEGVECAFFSQGMTETGKNTVLGVAKLVCAKKLSSDFFVTESTFDIGIKKDTVAKIYKTKDKLHLVLVDVSEHKIQKVTMKLPSAGHFKSGDKVGYSEKDSEVFTAISKGHVFGLFDKKESHRSMLLDKHEFKGLAQASSDNSNALKLSIYLLKEGTHYRGTISSSLRNEKMSLKDVKEITPGIYKRFSESSAHRHSQLGFPFSMDQSSSKCGPKDGYKQVVYGNTDEHYFLSYNSQEERVVLCTKDQTNPDQYLPLEEFTLKGHGVKSGDTVEVASFMNRRMQIFVSSKDTSIHKPFRVFEFELEGIEKIAERLKKEEKEASKKGSRFLVKNGMKKANEVSDTLTYLYEYLPKKFVVW